MKYELNRQHKKTEKYSVSIRKSQDNYSRSNIKFWLEEICKGTWNMKEHKHQLRTTFSNLNDAFQFKMYWQRA